MIRKTLPLLASLILLFLIVWLGRLVFADFIAAEAAAVMHSWQKTGQPAFQEWPSVQVALDKSIELDPGNPEYLGLMANLYRTQSFAYPAHSDESTQSNTKAIEFYLLALQQRPSWPEFWSGIVQSKHALWVFDDAMQLAIRNAVRFGPQYPAVQRVVLRAGMEGWPFLEADTRKAVLVTLDRALHSQTRVVMKMVKLYGFDEQAGVFVSED